VEDLMMNENEFDGVGQFPVMPMSPGFITANGNGQAPSEEGSVPIFAYEALEGPYPEPLPIPDPEPVSDPDAPGDADVVRLPVEEPTEAPPPPEAPKQDAMMVRHPGPTPPPVAKKPEPTGTEKVIKLALLAGGVGLGLWLVHGIIYKK
jgi:hypothetical protein